MKKKLLLMALAILLLKTSFINKVSVNYSIINNLTFVSEYKISKADAGRE